MTKAYQPKITKTKACLCARNLIDDRAAAAEHPQMGGSPQSRGRGSGVERHDYSRGGVSPLSDVGWGPMRTFSKVSFTIGTTNIVSKSSRIVGGPSPPTARS
jgi:hypothetical protein